MQRQKLKIENDDTECLKTWKMVSHHQHIPSWIGFIDVTLYVHWCSVSVGSSSPCAQCIDLTTQAKNSAANENKMPTILTIERYH